MIRDVPLALFKKLFSAAHCSMLAIYVTWWGALGSKSLPIDFIYFTSCCQKTKLTSTIFTLPCSATGRDTAATFSLSPMQLLSLILISNNLVWIRLFLSKIFTLVVDCIGNQINQRQLDKSSLVGNLDPPPSSPPARSHWIMNLCSPAIECCALT